MRFDRHGAAVHDLDWKDACTRGYAIHAGNLAACRRDARTTRAMDVVVLSIIERMAKNLRPRVKMVSLIAVVFVNEEIAPAQVPPLIAIRPPPNIAAQIGMLDVHAVVDDCDRNPFPARVAPCLAHLGDVQVPM